MVTVKIFTTPTCPWCKKAKEYMKKEGIKFKELDVASDEKARDEMIEKSGQSGVPVLEIKDTIIVGFDPKEIKKTLKS